MSHWKDFIDPDARGGRFLPWKEVARATGLSRTTAWRLQKRSDFPAPYAISPGRVGYREDEIEAWRASRGHSAAWLRGAPRQPCALEAAHIQAAQPVPEASADRSKAPQARPGPTADERPAIPSSPPPQGVLSPVRSGSRAHRRSQHAKAIAQQMRFDF